MAVLWPFCRLFGVSVLTVWWGVFQNYNREVMPQAQPQLSSPPAVGRVLLYGGKVKHEQTTQTPTNNTTHKEVVVVEADEEDGVKV